MEHRQIIRYPVKYMALKIAYSAVDGVELYSHRGNKCESPYGFIKAGLREETDDERSC